MVEIFRITSLKMFLSIHHVIISKYPFGSNAASQKCSRGTYRIPTYKVKIGTGATHKASKRVEIIALFAV